MKSKKMLIIFVAIFISKTIYTDSRVLCGGPYTSPWIALGYGCPINCNNVIDAINRLKQFDYEYLLIETKQYQKLSTQSTRTLEKYLELHMDHVQNYTSARKFNLLDISNEYQNSMRHLIRAFLNTFENPKTQVELKAQMKIMSYERAKCSKFVKGYNKKMAGNYKKCARRFSSVEEYLYKVITDILNKHTETMKFTVNMTKILLRKVFGDRTDLRVRNDDLDMNIIMQYLRDVLSSMEPKKDKPTIKLKTKHCLNLSVPGCYCIRGFVEKSGSCVRPLNCTLDVVQKTYLSRVIVD